MVEDVSHTTHLCGSAMERRCDEVLHATGAWTVVQWAMQKHAEWTIATNVLGQQAREER
jgi:hypothetical protein